MGRLCEACLLVAGELVCCCKRLRCRQAVVVFRRTVFVAADAALLLFPSIQLLAFSLINVASLMASVLVRPYAVASYNRLEMWSLLSLLMISLVLQAFANGADIVVRACLFALVVLPPASILFYSIAIECKKREPNHGEQAKSDDFHVTLDALRVPLTSDASAS